MSEKKHPGPIYQKRKTRRIVAFAPNTKGKKRYRFRKRKWKKYSRIQQKAQRRVLTFEERRKRRHRISSIILTFLTAATLIWIVFFSPVFALNDQKISVNGANKYIDEAAVTSKLNPYLGKPITMLNIQEIEQKIYTINGVSAANIERIWPNGLSIQITPSAPIAFIAEGKKYLLIDSLHKTVQISKNKPSGFPEIASDEKTTTFILKALENMSEKFRKNITVLSAKSFDSISSKLKNGKVIFWGSNEDIPQKEKVVKKILEIPKLINGKKTIDISAKDKPIIK